jgi:hypothetical protein
VPVCILCTLDRKARGDHYQPDYGFNWRRSRCLGCGRPMRIDASWTFGTPKTCCEDCARTAENRANNARRRIAHEPMVCPECGTSFVPKRRSRVTCSNNCRQARYQRAHAQQTTVRPDE